MKSNLKTQYNDTNELDKDELRKVKRLVGLSGGGVLDRFSWPDTIGGDVYWMPVELLSIYDTPYINDFSEAELKELSRLESLSFYSENVHGELYLLEQLLDRHHELCTSEELTEFLNIFIKEESNHIEVFSHFCKKYGELLPNNRVEIGSPSSRNVENFLFFSRVLMFENFVDYINQKLSKSKSVPEIVSSINSYHCEDEARHVSFGSLMVKKTFKAVKEECSNEEVVELTRYVEDYMLNTIELFYNSKVYSKFAIENPEEFRIKVLTSPGRRRIHKDWLRRSCKLFTLAGVFDSLDPDALLDRYFAESTGKTDFDGFSKLVSWVEENSNVNSSIEKSQNLFESGVIDSLKFMQLLTVIGETCGKPVALEEVDLSKLTSLEAIEKAYF